MNALPKTPASRVAASLVASITITFTGLILIANYAHPEPSADTLTAAVTAAAAPTR